jgi:hypothetical protein
VFAIFNDVNAKQSHNPEGNVLPFAQVFKMDAVTLNKLTHEKEEEVKDSEHKQLEPESAHYKP